MDSAYVSMSNAVLCRCSSRQPCTEFAAGENVEATQAYGGLPARLVWPGHCAVFVCVSVLFVCCITLCVSLCSVLCTVRVCVY